MFQKYNVIKMFNQNTIKYLKVVRSINNSKANKLNLTNDKCTLNETELNENFLYNPDMQSG